MFGGETHSRIFNWPHGGAQKSPERPKFGPKLPKRSSEPNSSSNYTRNMALRDLNTFKYTNICILSRVGADANCINFILTQGGLKSTLRNHNLGQKSEIRPVYHLISLSLPIFWVPYLFIDTPWEQ